MAGSIPYAPRSEGLRRLPALLLAVAVALGLLITTATAGYADPSPAPGDIEAQINQQWNTLEPLIEKYNSIHEQYTAMQGRVAGLQAQIQPLAMQVDLAMSRVGAISASAYKSGPGSKFTALLQSGSPENFIERLTTLDEIARHESSTVADVAKLCDQFQQQKQPLDDALAQLQQQDAALSTQKSTIETKIKQLDGLRLTAYGANAGTGNLRPVTCPQVYTGDAGSRAAKFACQQIGKRYVFGTDGPDTYDCSGLTSAAWRSVGVDLPHNALEQKHVTHSVSSANLRSGDLVYYYADTHHVVIYVGNGWVVSAPTYGIPVEMQKIDMSRYNGSGRP